jgi:hypothetical protein
MTIDQQKSTSSNKGGTGTHQYQIVNAPNGVGVRTGPGSNSPVVHDVVNKSLTYIVGQ